VRDYARKCGFEAGPAGAQTADRRPRPVIAGGGAGRETTWSHCFFSSPYSSEGSRSDATAMALRLGIRIISMALPPPPPPRLMNGSMQSPERATLQGAPVLDRWRTSAIAESSTLLHAVANQQGQAAAATGNKSELAVGYCKTATANEAGGLA